MAKSLVSKPQQKKMAVFQTWSVLRITGWYIGSLHGIILLLGFYVMVLLIEATDDDKPRPLYLPPQLDVGLVTTGEKPPPETVYSFAFYIWGLLNTWHANGEQEFYENIVSYSPYLTERCRMELEVKAREYKDGGAYKNVRRRMSAVMGKRFSHESVTPTEEGDGWRVKFFMNLQESLDDAILKDADIEYSIIVVPLDVAAVLNPWLLGIDCTEKDRTRRLTT